MNNKRISHYSNYVNNDLRKTSLCPFCSRFEIKRNHLSPNEECHKTSHQQNWEKYSLTRLKAALNQFSLQHLIYKHFLETQKKRKKDLRVVNKRNDWNRRVSRPSFVVGRSFNYFFFGSTYGHLQLYSMNERTISRMETSFRRFESTDFSMTEK